MRRLNPLDLASEHPSLDWVGAGLIVGLHAAAVTRIGRFDPLDALQPQDRVNLYGQALQPAVILVGFTLAALGFMYATSGRRMTTVRDIGHHSLVRTWIGAVSGPLLAAGLLLAAIVVEDNGSSFSRWMAELAAALLVLRTARFLWLIAALLGLRRADDVEVPNAPPTSSFQRRRAG